ncbi:hypothetical protein MNBD_GAMMA03-239 [hydrothermal vent metagenome]|uniref:EpsG family protein n=1 Tax=hydrothermal vent metagenome TaxID=652676 RepID=A0A3B0W3R1_9ZZZZ
MLAYFILLFIPLALAWLYPSALHQKLNVSFQTKQSLIPWITTGIIFTLFIGYRHEVGGDWGTYLRHFQFMNYFTFEETLKKSDPGYYAINWLMADWGYEIYAVNLICGAIFMAGLMIFAKRQPNPWLALAVAIPYLIVVIAMGYTRQAVALGLVFWGLAALEKKQFKQFLMLMVIAATFHKSAVLMIGLGVFLQDRGKFIRALAVGFVGFGLYAAFLANYQQDLWKNYVEIQMESQGAFIRVAMNLVPAIIFLIYRKRWKQQFDDYSFWVMIAIGSIASIFIVSLASTAVDRVALYFTPIQVVVFSRLPLLLRDKFNPQAVTLGVLLFYLLVLFVWLNYATHAQYWVPYNNILFDGVS